MMECKSAVSMLLSKQNVALIKSFWPLKNHLRASLQVLAGTTNGSGGERNDTESVGRDILARWELIKAMMVMFPFLWTWSPAKAGERRSSKLDEMLNLGYQYGLESRDCAIG